MHWHRKGYNVKLGDLIKYAEIDENTLSECIESKLDGIVVALAKVGGGYVLRNSLVIPVLDYKEENLLESYKHGAIAVFSPRVMPGYPNNCG